VSATKHTPGPWEWVRGSNELRPVNPDPNHSAVASILYAEGGFGFIGSSNAASLAELDADRVLIAAAPDLLQALARLMRNFPTDADMLKAGWLQRDVDEACSAHEAAHIVYAKAIGATA